MRRAVSGFSSFLKRTPATWNVKRNIALESKTKIEKIDGLQIATEARAVERAAIAVVVNTGSGHETPENNGVAHFLEHLAFKGTSNRTKKQLELEVENMGGVFNAFTSREHTTYIMTVFKNDVEKAVDILADIIQNSNYNSADIEYEKGVILREMEEVNSVVEEFAMDHLHEIAFDGSSLGFTILGPKENIQSFTRESIMEYVESYHTRNRIAVVGSGAVDHDQLVELAQKKITSVRESSPRDIDMMPQPEFIGAYRNLESNISADNYGILAYEGASWSSGEMIPMLLIQTIIGNYDVHMGVGDQLFSNLAHRVAATNPCESIKSFITSYDTTGLVGCSFSSKLDDLEPLMQTIAKEYASLARDISDEDVSRAKRRLKATLASMYDDITNVCEDMGRQVFTVGRRVSVQEYFDRIDAIDTKIIRDTCIRHFIDTKPSIVTVGKVNDFDYEKVNEWTKW